MKPDVVARDFFATVALLRKCTSHGNFKNRGFRSRASPTYTLMPPQHISQTLSALFLCGWATLASAQTQSTPQTTQPPAHAALLAPAKPAKSVTPVAPASHPQAASAPAVTAAPQIAPVQGHSFWQDAGLLDMMPEAAKVKDFVRDGASDLVLGSMNFLGVPYRRGGNTASTGLDCSGFTRLVFEQSLGRLLPRRAAEQASDPSLLRVSEADLKPGDLVFFKTMRHAFSHVGIYVGAGQFIHAPRTGKAVELDDMRGRYWQSKFSGARRIPSLLGSAHDPVGYRGETQRDAHEGQPQALMDADEASPLRSSMDRLQDALRALAARAPSANSTSTPSATVDTLGDLQNQ